MLLGIHWGDPRLAGITITVLMSQLSISSLNDWADRRSDAAAGRWRPVAMGRIPPFVALGLAILFAVGTLPGAFAFGVAAGFVFFLGLAAGWAYDLSLKWTPLSFLPFAIAFPLLPIWTGLVAGRRLPDLLMFFVIGAPIAVAIHMADSMADLESDAASGMRNLAVALGRLRSVRAMQATLLLGSLLVVKSFLYQVPFAILLGVTAMSGALLAGKTAAENPNRTRWVVTATALALIIPWLGVHR
jgi:4-hydroxybenzoate polyprenyltransferase